MIAACGRHCAGVKNCSASSRQNKRTSGKSFEYPVIMIIGVPREIKDQEYRVALLPSAAYQLIQRGHQVVVERGAGTGAGYPDGDYEQAGAKLVDGHAAVFELADLLVKVKEPQPSEYPLLRPRQMLFT